MFDYGPQEIPALQVVVSNQFAGVSCDTPASELHDS